MFNDFPPPKIDHLINESGISTKVHIEVEMSVILANRSGKWEIVWFYNGKLLPIKLRG